MYNEYHIVSHFCTFSVIFKEFPHLYTYSLKQTFFNCLLYAKCQVVRHSLCSQEVQSTGRNIHVLKKPSMEVSIRGPHERE